MAVHERTISTSNATTHAASDGHYLALPSAKNSFEIWDLQQLSMCKPMSVQVHKHAVTALCFSHRCQPTLICSASQDYVILWSIDRIRAADNTGQLARGQVLVETLARVQHLTFSPHDLYVAACVEKETFIMDIKNQRLDTRLRGHNAPVTCAEFCLYEMSHVVTASEDRTFKIWDISNSTLIYQSTIISASPFISLAMSPIHEEFALGTADGQVRVYDLTEGNGFQCIHHCDVNRLLAKMRKARIIETSLQESPSWLTGPTVISSVTSKHHLDSPLPPPDLSPDGEEGCSILALYYGPLQEEPRSVTPVPQKLSFLQHDSSLVSELLQSRCMLLVGTTASLLQLNAQTLDLDSCVRLQEPIPSCSLLQDGDRNICLAAFITFAQSDSTNKIWCFMGTLFTNEMDVLRVIPGQSSQPGHQSSSMPDLSPHQTKSMTSCMGDDDERPILSVLSSHPLHENSPLKSDEFILKVKQKDPQKKRHQAQTAGTLSRTGRIVDEQPLTFHQKISSSQYAVLNRQKMFQLKSKTMPKQSKSPSKSRSAVSWRYSDEGEAPTRLDLKVDVAERPTSINAITFSEDGSRFLCSLANTTVQLFRVPPTHRGAAFSGHKGSVTSANWSHDGQWFVTSSDDRSACVWSERLADPLMSLTTVKHNHSSSDRNSASHTVFDHAVKFVQFYYVDKFILLTSGNKFYLYKYHLDTTKSDIKRYLNNNRYKLVQSFQMEQANHISAFSAVNTFHSYLAFACGSDKTLQVFDLNVGQRVRTISDVHSRIAHAIVQNKGSSYVNQPGSAYDLFITAAAADCIKLWDLRSNRCVRRYEGHMNRTHPCGVSISPCSRFIATGSEDRSAYIYDIRSSKYLHKITGHTDTVTDVAFNPLIPQLLTASTDGKIRSFIAP